MIVGNDVVDLGAAHPHPRFVERVCTAEEQRRIARAPEPERLLWTVFAAKEAAYKVSVKLGLEPGFAHRRFVVSPELDAVRHGERMFSLSIAEGADFVHAVVGPSTLSRVEAGSDAREALLRALAEELGCARGRLSVEREPRPGSWDGFGPPRVVGAPCGVDVSLSHDGRFVAFAAVLGREAV